MDDGPHVQVVHVGGDGGYVSGCGGGEGGGGTERGRGGVGGEAGGVCGESSDVSSFFLGSFLFGVWRRVNCPVGKGEEWELDVTELGRGC